MSTSWNAATSATTLMNWWGSNQLIAAAQKHAQEAAETAATLARKATELAEQAAETAKGLVAQASEEAPKLLSLAPHQRGDSTTKQAAGPPAEEFIAYGVTDELVTFAKGLTYSTFSDYPSENLQPLFPLDKPRAPDSKGFQLSPWQERHARLVLQRVPSLQDLRFVLCPRRMTEERFWTIYFNTMGPHLPHQAFGWHGALETRPPLAPRSQQRTLAESGRVSSVPGNAAGGGGTLSPLSSHRDNTSVADSSSLVMVDKWSDAEGGHTPQSETDPDLDAYLREALTIQGSAEDVGVEGAEDDDASNTEDLDDYLDQLDAEIQDAANKAGAS